MSSSDSLDEEVREEGENKRERERGKERQKESVQSAYLGYVMIIPRSHDHELGVENNAL